MKTNASAKAHEFTLLEAAEQSKYLMSEAEETLAAELTLSGGSAFGKLQGTLTSQMTVDFELDGEVKKMPMPALINLRSHPDESVRRRGYEAENKAWEGVKETLAACLNGVKGQTLILDKKRGREDNLHASIDAKAAVDSGAAILVDVRSADSYASGHAAGAISIPLGNFETNIESLSLEKDQWIITYCT